MFIANEVNPFAVMIIRKSLTVALLDATVRRQNLLDKLASELREDLVHLG